jgi:hypothetical protein
LSSRSIASEHEPDIEKKRKKREEDKEMIVETTELKRRKNMWRVVVAISALWVLHSLSPAVGQERYEPSAALSASRILPPELLSGANHRVQERVKNDGIVNIYTIDSRFGSFTAVSTAMLRIRIQEINAMAAMDKLKGTKE